MRGKGLRVAVVGGGIFGQVIAWRLAVRGAHVSLIEPVGPGHGKSGSGDRTRVVRAFYGRRDFARAGKLALERWGDYGRELGVPLVETVGVAYFDRKGSEAEVAQFRAYVDGGLAALRELGSAVEVLTPGEAVARWPAIATADLERVVFEPAGGFGKPALACRAIARAAIETGRVTPIAAEATRVDERGGRAAGVAVRVGADAHASIAADAVIVAAGASGACLVEPFLPGPLPIRRVPHFTSTWDVPYPEGAALHRAKLPVWIDLGARLYGMPDDGENGFKMAWHEPVRAGGAQGEPSASELAELRAAGARRFPALERATLRGVYACSYDSTPDENFLVGPVPGLPGLTFVGGLSGHGYKHAPAIGEAVVAAVLGDEIGGQRLDLAPYALG